MYRIVENTPNIALWVYDLTHSLEQLYIKLCQSALWQNKLSYENE